MTRDDSGAGSSNIAGDRRPSGLGNTRQGGDKWGGVEGEYKILCVWWMDDGQDK